MAAETARLQLEAAKLRAEAAELNRAGDEERRTSRAGALLTGTLSSDGKYAMSPTELPARISAVSNFEPTEAEVARLCAAVGRPGEALGYEELASVAFDSELERIVGDRRQQEAQRQAQEREAQTAAAQARQAESSAAGTAPAGSPAANDDLSTGTRILGALAYLLPLVDSIQFAVLLVKVFPIFTPVVALLAIPAVVVNALPYGIGTIILFGAWLFLSAQPQYPRLVRFNLLQAVYLDMAFFLPATFLSLISGGLPPELGAFLYLVLFSVCCYCAFKNSQGEYPDGLPGISNFAQTNVDQLTEEAQR